MRVSHPPPADQPAEVELPRLPTEDTRPMSRISALRGPRPASLPTTAVPRFGVQTDQEAQLAKVGLPRATGLSFPPWTLGSQRQWSR